MLAPKLIVLDEPSAGLAPQVAAELLSERIPALAASGTAVLLVEQRAIQALEIADWAYVMMAGRATMHDAAEQILGRDDVGALFLGRARDQGSAPAADLADSTGVGATRA
jgi:branched-chain amino acid transport system ATP-binding protein